MKHARRPLLLAGPLGATVLSLALACAGAPAAALAVDPAREPAPDEGARVRPLRPVAGAEGIGDPYYPGLGNGGYDVQHYALVLDVDAVEGHLAGEATITARALQDLASFNLDLHALTVEAVDVDGATAAFEHVGRELTVEPAEPLASGTEFVVRVVYGGRPELVPEPALPSPQVPGVGWVTAESGTYVLSECVGAASWFPCNDHPRDKATFSYEVTVPKPLVVAANGLLVEEREEGDLVTYVWRARDPMATYLATVNVSEFGLVLEEGPHGMPLRLYHPPDATEAELAEFARTAEMIEFFEGLFGPYPFECYGAVLGAEQFGGALETQTIPVYSRGSDESVLAHELAHQWFGNSVSPTVWADMWLNEGFASYAEFLWFEHVEGFEAAEGRAKRAYGFLKRSAVGSPADPGVEAVFGPRTYGRGSWVLHGLRREVGDEAFFEILRGWCADNANGHGTTAGFVAHAQEVAGRDLTDFFDGYLYADEIPYEPDYEG